MAFNTRKRWVAPGVTALAAAAAWTAMPAAAETNTVQAAKTIIQQAETGLVAAKDPKKTELELTIEDFAPVTDWSGPKTSAKAPEHKKVVVISCATVAPFCANVSQGSVEAAKALGWEGSYLDGKGSVQGFVQAFETAINEKPDAIIPWRSLRA
jgi:ABC-type sugar transport system substrate-binding protein